VRNPDLGLDMRELVIVQVDESLQRTDTVRMLAESLSTTVGVGIVM